MQNRKSPNQSWLIKLSKFDTLVDQQWIKTPTNVTDIHGTF